MSVKVLKLSTLVDVDYEQTELYTKSEVDALVAAAGGGGSGSFAVLLNYNATTDLFNGTPLSSGWTDVISNQSFSKTGGVSLLEVSCGGGMHIGEGGGQQVATRLVIDSAGTPVYVYLGAFINPASGYANPLSGTSKRVLSSIGSGSHTIKLQVYTQSTGNKLYLRASSVPNADFLNLQVIEIG